MLCAFFKIIMPNEIYFFRLYALFRPRKKIKYIILLFTIHVKSEFVGYRVYGYYYNISCLNADVGIYY